jgi:hypothetical protein
MRKGVVDSRLIRHAFFDFSSSLASSPSFPAHRSIGGRSHHRISPLVFRANKLSDMPRMVNELVNGRAINQLLLQVAACQTELVPHSLIP